MKNIILIIFVITFSTIYSQNEINWDGIYILKESDFQSPSTQIGKTSVCNIFTATGFEFSINMSNLEFMFTKNFNSKVSNVFKPQSASIVAPDIKSAKFLIDFAQYQFNLSELYARILRKKLFEGKKPFQISVFLNQFTMKFKMNFQVV